MAHLFRLIAVLLFALPLGVAAQEYVPASKWWKDQHNQCRGFDLLGVAACVLEKKNVGDFGSQAEWCDAGGLNPEKDPETLPEGWWIEVQRSYRTAPGQSCNLVTIGNVTWQASCLDGSLVVGGMCALPECPAGVRSSVMGSVRPPQQICSFGCTANVGTCIEIDGEWGCETVLSGGSCTGDEWGAGEELPDMEDEHSDELECLRKGMTYGAVDGVSMCLPRGTPGGAETIDDETTSQETDVDGSVTKVDKTTTTITNVDGSVTVITTTVTTTGVGTPGESTSTEIDAFTGTRTQVCADRPNLPVCGSGGGGGGDGEGEGGGGEFAGSCASGFVCEGDPIQCAIAKEQHVRACQLFEDETDESLVYANALAGDDPGDAALDPANAREVGLEGVIDDGGFLAGSCLDDLVVPLWDGQSLTVPFSELCPHLEFMGMIVVAFSMLAAARIMFV